jgi:ribonuclease-3
MKSDREKQLRDFLKKQNLSFDNLEIMDQALTHSSLANRFADKEDNERLEFLGDSVLSLCISEYLYRNFPEAAEGRLTRIRSYIVSEKSLAFIARKIGVGDLLLLSWGEENSGGRENDANLADAFEALLGSLFLDQGIDAVKPFLLKLAVPEIERVSEEDFIYDFKTELQYMVQKKYKQCPSYEVIKEEGPPHDRIFHTRLVFQGRDLGQGQGGSKKKAEQQAAKQALEKIKKNEIEL